MSKVQWIKYKNYEGAKALGSNRYNPPQPYGPWTKIFGVVARSEGNHDTMISYDDTGVTWGFLQWTMKSGRLQKLLESFKSIAYFDFDSEVLTEESQHLTLFDDVCCYTTGEQIFEEFGFTIHGGVFVSAKHGALNPSNKKEQRLIVDTCMGKIAYPSSEAKQKVHAMALARKFCELGKAFGVADAQVSFAKTEFKRSMNYQRPNMPNWGSIYNMLDGTWDTPLPALFFNLWQNGPSMAQKIFDKNIEQTDKNNPNDLFHKMWKKINQSKYANWGWKSKSYLNGSISKPRIVRIKKAMKEFYALDLPYYK